MTTTPCWREVGIYGGDRSCAKLVEHVHCRSCPVFTAAGRALLDRPTPEGWQAAAAALVSESAPVATATQPWLVFRLGRAWLGLELTVLVEVAPARRVHRIPHRDASVLAGLVNIRGQLLLCASLHALLGVRAEPGADPHERRLLHFTPERESWTFIADEVDGVADVPRGAALPVPSSIGLSPDTFAQGTFEWKGRQVTLLNASQLGAALRREVG
jgi:chemotaxis-related protein WspD